MFFYNIVLFSIIFSSNNKFLSRNICSTKDLSHLSLYGVIVLFCCVSYTHKLVHAVHLDHARAGHLAHTGFPHPAQHSGHTACEHVRAAVAQHGLVHGRRQRSAPLACPGSRPSASGQRVRSSASTRLGRCFEVGANFTSLFFRLTWGVWQTTFKIELNFMKQSSSKPVLSIFVS
jgi:hypothetical protein